MELKTLKSGRTFLIALVVLLAGVISLPAQSVNSAMSSRDQIQQALDQAEKIVSSPGYSGRLKQSKRREISMLKTRLQDGDLQPGDQIFLTVLGEAPLSATFSVTADRLLILPGIGDISMKGVLRSEVEEHLTKEVGRYLRNPQVHASTSVRLSILGAVGKPGFYQIKSETLIGDAIMEAGGPASNVDPAKTRIDRGGREIVSQEAFVESLNKGRTLDQMSLLAGDEIIVGGNRTNQQRQGAWTYIVPIFSSIAGLGYLISQIF